MWAGRLPQEGENGFAVLDLAKRTAGLKDKLKRKGKGDQAQQPGAHSAPVDKGQEGQLIWFVVQRRPLLLTTLLLHRVRVLLQHPTVQQHLGLRALLWQSPRLLQARRLRHRSQTSRERSCQTFEKSKGRSDWTSCKLSPHKRRETRRLLTLSRASVLPAVGCRHARCGPPGWSSMRPCSVLKYQCSRLLLRRFSVCRRVSNWEVSEPSRLTSQGKGHACVGRPPVGDAVRPLRIERFGRQTSRLHLTLRPRLRQSTSVASRHRQVRPWVGATSWYLRRSS